MLPSTSLADRLLREPKRANSEAAACRHQRIGIDDDALARTRSILAAGALRAAWFRPARPGLVGDAIAETLKLGRIQIADPRIFLSRHNDGDIAVLAANYDRLALGRVQQCGKTLLSLGRGYASHLSIIDEIDIINQHTLHDISGTLFSVRQKPLTQCNRDFCRRGRRAVGTD